MENGALSDAPLIQAESKGSPCSSPPDDGIVVGVWFVYILRCADNALYIGETSDLDARIARHNRGQGCSFTSRRTPVTLAYSESCSERPAALAREKQPKRWTRAKKEALIAGDLALLKRL